jgi:hypothetical protein
VTNNIDPVRKLLRDLLMWDFNGDTRDLKEKLAKVLDSEALEQMEDD